VIVPNARFADAILTNYHRPEQDLSVQVTGTLVTAGQGRNQPA
jgi:hypothetical protein